MFVAVLGGIAYGAVVATRRSLHWPALLGTGAVFLTAVAAVLLLSQGDIGTPMIVLLASSAASHVVMSRYVGRQPREPSDTD